MPLKLTNEVRSGMWGELEFIRRDTGSNRGGIVEQGNWLVLVKGELSLRLSKSMLISSTDSIGAARKSPRTSRIFGLFDGEFLDLTPDR